MKEVIRKEITYDLGQIQALLEKGSDPEQIRILSDHTISDVAAYKDMDMITITVLIYALYKIYPFALLEDKEQVLEHVSAAKVALAERNLGEYNAQIRTLYTFIQSKSSSVKDHLESVMQAARVKKGTVLLEHGLTIGQAAGLMGLSNWDLQEYASKTAVFEPTKETMLTSKRLKIAYSLFNL